VPNVGEFADPALLVEMAQRAESAGWEGFFVWDHLFYRAPRPQAVEPWSVIAAAAAITSRIRLGVLMTAVPRRRPALLAQQVATIDHLATGRIVFGAGLGSMPAEYEQLGEDSDPRVRARRLDEALGVLDALWSDRPVRHVGEHYTVRDVDLSPKPLQRPRPPIWIAGRWPNRAPFRRAARFDGVMPTHARYGHDGFMRPVELMEVVRYLRSLRPDLGGFDIVLEGQSSDRLALAKLIPMYAAAGLTWWVEKLGWWRGGRAAALARVDDGA
jgi:alkanesulfonate monooxygenase SsuD/methylene tetrahydromethanopterin reductase-like flavin-dependent oxidoreductase (luciferase family)